MAGQERLTQCEKIIQYMTEEGCITPIDALREFGIMRLASRISDIRKAGYSINKQMVSAQNRYGETVHFAMYSFGEVPQ